MLERFNFTKDKIEALQSGSKRYWVTDTKTPYLRISVFPSGIKTFMLCRKIKGRSQRIKIGRLKDLSIEQARKEAVRLNALIALGGDPNAEKQAAKKELTFKELYNYYYKGHALPFTKHPRANRKILDYHVFPEFGNLKASEITPERIRRFHARIAETRANSSANRIVTLIATVFNFCIKNSYFNGPNPCKNVKKFRTTSRDRFLSPEELKKFFEAIKDEEQLFHHFFLLLLLTGARKSNVLAMKWADIDLRFKRWRISEVEAKNRDVNVVPLCERALEILSYRSLQNESLQAPSLYVFPGESKDGYLKDPKRAFDRVRSRMDIKNFTMHDLRRTLGSYMAISGASLPMIGKALNHKSQVSTAIYARLSQEPVLDAVNTAVSLIQNNGLAGMFKANADLTRVENAPLQFSALLV